MKKFAFVLSVVMLAVIATGCGSNTSGITLAGSTSVQPYAEILAEHYQKIHTDETVDVQGGGSEAGITAAISNTADLGMSSRSLTAEDGKLWSVEIAKDGIAIIVHPKNPVKNLTTEQLRNIYTGKITNWNQVGGANHIINIVAREEGSGTRTAFEGFVMNKAAITPKAVAQDSNGAVKQIIADDEFSIGYISLGLVDKTVKDVNVNNVAPTRANVINHTYTFYRPFLFVASKEPTGITKQFVDYVLSAEGQKILHNEGLVTLGEK